MMRNIRTLAVHVFLLLQRQCSGSHVDANAALLSEQIPPPSRPLDPLSKASKWALLAQQLPAADQGAAPPPRVIVAPIGFGQPFAETALPTAQLVGVVSAEIPAAPPATQMTASRPGQPVAERAEKAVEQPGTQLAALTAANAASAAVDAAKVAAIAAKTAASAASVAASASTAAAAASVAASAATPVHFSRTAAMVPLTVQASGRLPAAPAKSEALLHPYGLTQLLLGLTFTTVVKALCVASNVLVQISPLPQVRGWVVAGNTGESDAAPFVAIAFGGCQWCFYGMFAFLVTSKSGFLILVQSNCIGALLGSYYVATFYRNCRNKASLSTMQKYLSAVSALVILQVCSLSTLPANRALLLSGLVSSFCTLLGSFAVLVTVPAVIRTQDSSSIPGAYALANMCAGFLWIVCGYILEDPMVILPNIFATCCCAASLSLKFAYPAMSKDDKLRDIALDTLEKAASNKAYLAPLKKAIASFEEDENPTELSSLHAYLSTPSQRTPMKTGVFSAAHVSSSKMGATSFPQQLEYFKGTGRKLLAAAGLPDTVLAWSGDGTGGTF